MNNWTQSPGLARKPGRQHEVHEQTTYYMRPHVRYAVYVVENRMKGLPTD